MTFDTLTVDVDRRGVARLVLARPERRNALSGAMIAELTRAAEALAADATVRVVVLAAQGGTFCAGADLDWMREQTRADPATRAAEARRLARMLGTLSELPKPLVGEVQGPAFGGGVGLVAVCDVAIGAEDARFALTETRLGLIPATIGPYVLARLGEGGARRLMLLGRAVGAAEAVALGLLARAVAPDALAEAVEEEVASTLACAPGAVADAKALLRTLGGVDPAIVERSVEALVARWGTAEAAAGIEAFFARRDPPWRRRDGPADG